MKKSQVNAILINQTKKRQVIFSLIGVAALCFIAAFSFFITYLNKNKDYYVSYNESSNINYKVHLKENEFFNTKYLEANKQYIASLINYITADFQYRLSLDEDNVEYKYSYRIEAKVNVAQTSTGNSLYSSTHEIKRDTKKTTSTQIVLLVHYNSYNQYLHFRLSQHFVYLLFFLCLFLSHGLNYIVNYLY